MEVTLCLLFVLVGILTAVTMLYYHTERRRCFERLTECAQEAVDIVYQEINAERKYLETAAAVMESGDMQKHCKLQAQLSVMGGSGILSQFSILLPGNWMLSADSLSDTTRTVSFKEEAEKGSHILKTKTFSGTEEIPILRICVPIKQENQTVGILCGVIEFEKLLGKFSIHEYRDTMQFYIMERSTGQFLLDTWHNSLGSTKELRERKGAAGYNREKFLEEFGQGKQGITVFESRTAGENFYASYAPIGIEDWMVMLSVPESSVFAYTRNILLIFFVQAFFLSAVFVVYILWTLHDINQDRKESEKTLKQVQYILDVEKQLFSTYAKPDHFQEALERIAGFLSAQSVFFWAVKEQYFGERCFWDSNQERFPGNQHFQKVFSGLFQKMQKEDSFVSYQLSEDLTDCPQEQKLLLDNQIKSLMLVCVKNLEGENIAVLGAVNMEKYWENAEPLLQVSLSFSAAAEQYVNYQALRKMGSIDNLTGLLNRNSYHVALDLAARQKWKSFACVYMDANGLHEINNHLGHQAGDEMLVKTASALKQAFPHEEVYRIGGDEFVVLCRNRSEQEVYCKAEQVRTIVRECDYELSLGVQWQQGDVNVTEIVDAAETLMRLDKQKYYEKNGKERQVRLLNEKNAKIIRQKQDMDKFLSVIAPQFKGVYFVDLKKDISRHIFMASYFEEILKEDMHFSRGMLAYAKRMVKPEYYKQFQEFCNYTYLRELLERERNAEFLYQKLDSTWMQLCVLNLEDINKEQKETLWIFTEAEYPIQKNENLILGGGKR